MYHLFKGLYLYATSKEGTTLPPTFLAPTLTLCAEYSILLLGLDNAGKTTLLEQMKASHSTYAHPNLNTVPTVGQNVATITLEDMYLKIWDVGGQHSLRRLWQSYYASCHAIVFVIDSTDVGTDADLSKLYSRRNSSRDQKRKDSLGGNGGGATIEEEEEEEEEEVSHAEDEEGRLNECRLVLEDVLQHADAEGVPLLVLANKQDREDCVEVVRIKEGFVRRVFEGEKGASLRDSRVLPCSALTGTGVEEAVEWLRSRVKWNKEHRPPVMR
jgi:ADP-ribosylation factor related protein 1